MLPNRARSRCYRQRHSKTTACIYRWTRTSSSQKPCVAGPPSAPATTPCYYRASRSATARITLTGPATLTIRWDTFVNYVRQITGSLAYHGFYKVLIVNAHGSNRPVLDLAARLTIVENPDVQCGTLSWWDLKSVRDVVAGFRESDWTGHACELETSLYLAIDPGRVNMELARPDINPRMSRHFWSDLVDQPPAGYSTKVFMTEYWSTVSETGTWGDPTKATAEKGEAILQAAGDELAEIIAELRARPVVPRVPHQIAAVQSRNAAHHGAVPRFTV